MIKEKTRIKIENLLSKSPSSPKKSTIKVNRQSADHKRNTGKSSKFDKSVMFNSVLSKSNPKNLKNASQSPECSFLTSFLK